MSDDCQLPGQRLLGWLIDGHWEYAGPEAILAGLSAEAAGRRIDGLPYTIAELLAHLNWWQRTRLDLARGGELQDFTPGRDDWPPATAEDWPGLVEAFLDSCREIAPLADQPAALTRQVFDDYRVGDMLISHAGHNAYHLGQIALMRRLLGCWPENDGRADIPPENDARD